MRRLLKRLAPAAFTRWIRTWRETAPLARPVLLRLWLRRHSSARPEVVPRSPRLLFVCHGNILRSAAAAALARQLASAGRLGPGAEVASAGVGAVAGRPADPRGVVAGRELGLDLGPHRARPVTAEAVARADLILVMDRINAAELLARFPAAWPRTFLLGVLDARPGGQAEIQDPYSGDLDDVRAAFRRVVSAVHGLAARLDAPNPPR